MSVIDPNDDSLLRFIVWHHHFDEDRHERRLVAVRAYSTQAEALKHFRDKSAELLKLQSEGQADLHEYFSCGQKEPGTSERAAEARISRKKMRSGWIAQGLTKDQIGGSWFAGENP